MDQRKTRQSLSRKKQNDAARLLLSSTSVDNSTGAFVREGCSPLFYEPSSLSGETFQTRIPLPGLWRVGRQKPIEPSTTTRVAHLHDLVGLHRLLVPTDGVGVPLRDFLVLLPLQRPHLVALAAEVVAPALEVHQRRTRVRGERLLVRVAALRKARAVLLHHFLGRRRHGVERVPLGAVHAVHELVRARVVEAARLHVALLVAPRLDQHARFAPGRARRDVARRLRVGACAPRREGAPARGGGWCY
eukprot:1187364-Prorocentrum_minimum.AAC.6